MDSDKAFEEWYSCNAFDYERNPIGSNDCALQRKAWNAALIYSASISALDAEIGPPYGWKLVPIGPTTDMIVAGFESVPNRAFDGDNYPEEYDQLSGCQKAEFRARLCYYAMLDAAPKYVDKP